MDPPQAAVPSGITICSGIVLYGLQCGYLVQHGTPAPPLTLVFPLLFLTLFVSSSSLCLAFPALPYMYFPILIFLWPHQLWLNSLITKILCFHCSEKVASPELFCVPFNDFMLFSISCVWKECQFWKTAFLQLRMWSFRNALASVDPDTHLPSQLQAILATVIFQMWEDWGKIRI